MLLMIPRADSHRRLILLILLAMLWTTNISAQEATAQPNILFIMIDDLGWMDLNCQGSPQFTTPNIDRLAKQGMRFTDAYAAAPVCSPTRAAAVTGLAPGRVKVTNHLPDRWQFYNRNKTMGPGKSLNYLPTRYETVAETLKQAGYATAFIGKWHLMGSYRNEQERKYLPEKQGFDLNIGGCGMGGPGTFFAPYKIPNMEKGQPGDYLPDTIAARAIDYIESQSKKKQPFFLCLWHYTVHYPIQAPNHLLRKQSGDQKPTPQQHYQAMVEGMDLAVGRVLQSLDTTGIAKNTLVVFTSDNGNLAGYSSAKPLKHAKGYLSEGGIRVPLIIRYPSAVKAGSESSEPVITMDFAPTFLEAAKVKYDPKRYDGVSLLPELTGKGSLNRDAIYFHYPHFAFHGDNKMGSVIRAGDYKYIQYYGGHAPVLYNLRNDIGEQHDLSKQQPAQARKLQTKLQAWLKEIDAQFPRPYAEMPEKDLPGKKQ
jgi:arylsulfatase A-like enzyme